MGNALLRLPRERARQGVEHIAQRPALDVAIVRGYADVGKNAEHPDVLPEGMARRHRIENEGRAVVAVPTAEAPHRPFDEEQRQPHQHEADQIGNDEAAPSVLDGLHREAQKVAQADGIAGHCEDQTDAGPPGFVVVRH